MTDDLLSAAVGPSWDDYYRDRFARLDAAGIAQWNWAAALVPFWGGWRTLPLHIPLYVAEYFAVAFAGLGWLSVVGSSVTAAVLGLLTTGLVAGLLQGAFGTSWVRAGARAAIRRARRRTDGDDAVRAELVRQAPVRSLQADLTHALGSALVIGLALVAAMIALGHQT